MELVFIPSILTKFKGKLLSTDENTANHRKQVSLRPIFGKKSFTKGIVIPNNNEKNNYACYFLYVSPYYGLHDYLIDVLQTKLTCRT